MSSLEQLLLRLCFSVVTLFVVLLVKKRLRFIRRRDVPFFIAFGLLYSLFAFSGLSSIAFGTPIAVSIALVYTQPIFTAMIAWLTGKEKITPVRLGVVLMGVLGVFLVSGLLTSNVQFGLGLVLSTLTGFFYAVYLLLKRHATSGVLGDYAPYQVLFGTFVFALPSLVVVGLLLQNVSPNPLFVGLTAPNLYQLGLLFLFALVSTVLPYGLLNYVKVEEVSPTTEGLLLLGDPLMHTVWAMLFFQQYVTAIQYVGGALILLSAAINLRITARNNSL
jgi:DME family drug/metabolite transporter